MKLYEVMELENSIEKIAQDNDGEIPDDLLQQLIELEVQVPEKVNGIIKYIKHLEYFNDCCKQEESRIKELRKKAKNRIDSIKRYITPFVLKKGSFDTGTFKIGTRKSQFVSLEEGFDNDKYMKYRFEKTPIKNLIKDDLKKGVEIEGARLIDSENLQIK